METNSDKLIITATVAPAWMFSRGNLQRMKKKWNQSPEELADEIFRCCKAGAAVAHVHGHKPWAEERWQRVIKLVRDKCDVIIQVGLSGRPLEERTMLVTKLKPDMCSVSMTHSDERYTKMRANVLQKFEEVVQFLKLCRKVGVKPELEIHNTGALWNFLQYHKRRLIDPPPYLTLLFGWPGGRWTPPTMEEVIARVKLVPKEAVWFTAINPDIPVTGPDSPLHLSTLSIMLGGNVRVGTEDYPYVRPGVFAKDAEGIVKRIATIGRDLGREIATPAEARDLLKL